MVRKVCREVGGLDWFDVVDVFFVVEGLDALEGFLLVVVVHFSGKKRDAGE